MSLFDTCYAPYILVDFPKSGTNRWEIIDVNELPEEVIHEVALGIAFFGEKDRNQAADKRTAAEGNHRAHFGCDEAILSSQHQTLLTVHLQQGLVRNTLHQ